MTMRRRMFTTLLVALVLSGTLAMPAYAATAPTTASPRATASFSSFEGLAELLSNLWSGFGFGERVAERSIWVEPGVDTTVTIGQVRLVVPAEATREMQQGFRLTMAVQRVRDGVIVDLGPDGVIFAGRGVLLSFGHGVTSAEDAAGAALEMAERSYWHGNNPTFWVEHFSRYSGWF